MKDRGGGAQVARMASGVSQRGGMVFQEILLSEPLRFEVSGALLQWQVYCG